MRVLESFEDLVAPESSYVFWFDDKMSNLQLYTDLTQ